MGIAKRLHVVLAVLSLGAELLVMIASTVALQGMACRTDCLVPSTTAAGWVAANFELEWVTCQVNFLFGVLGLTAMVALRAWVSIACPLLAQATLGCLLSMLLMMLSLINSGKRLEGTTFVGAVGRYVALLADRLRRQPGICLLAGVLLGVISTARMGQVLWRTVAMLSTA